MRSYSFRYYLLRTWNSFLLKYFQLSVNYSDDLIKLVTGKLVEEIEGACEIYSVREGWWKG